MYNFLFPEATRSLLDVKSMGNGHILFIEKDSMANHQHLVFVHLLSLLHRSGSCFSVGSVLPAHRQYNKIVSGWVTNGFGARIWLQLLGLVNIVTDTVRPYQWSNVYLMFILYGKESRQLSQIIGQKKEYHCKQPFNSEPNERNHEQRPTET